VSTLLAVYRRTGADPPFGDPRGYHGVGMEGHFWRITQPDTGAVVVAILAISRDAEGRPWRSALTTLAATHCRQLIPALGKLGTCGDIAGLDRYFAALDRRVRTLVASGAGLADVASRAELPEFAAWAGYGALHAANANRAFLAVERAGFAD